MKIVGVLKRLLGVAGVAASYKGPTRASARSDLINIISRLRQGNRPSLVGQIPGLTAKMEKAFRTGQYEVWWRDLPGTSYYSLERTFGGETNRGGSWSSLGLKEKPDEAEKAEAFRIFNSWKEREVAFVVGDIKRARARFEKEITVPYGVTIENAEAEGEIYHVMEILRLLPINILRSGVIRRINTRDKRSGAARFGKYDDKDGKIRICDYRKKFDKYLLTVILLHELGHAVEETLTAEQKSALQSYHEKFRAKNAIFGTDTWGMSEKVRIEMQYDRSEFFAENFMHYIVLGEAGMTGAAINTFLRGELYRFYQGIVPPLFIPPTQ